MAELTITVANMRAVSGATFKEVKFGESGIEPGMLLYKDGDDNDEYKKADANDSAKNKVDGVAWSYGGDGEQGVIVTGNGAVLNLGATLTKDTTYVLSATAGKIVPESDLTTDDYIVRIGTASSTSQIKFQITNTGIQHS